MKVLILFSLVSLSFGIHLECFYTITNWSNLGDAYTCEGILSNISDIYYYSHSGIHQSGKSDSDVQMLYIINNTNLDYIPKYGDHFKNLTALYISSCGIKNIYVTDLISYPNLRWISLSKNLIEIVPGNFFVYTPNVETIFLYENKIKEVGRGLLNSLDNLIFANFKDNVCIDRLALTPNDLQLLTYQLLADCSNNDQTNTTQTPTTTTEAPRNSTTQQPNYTCGKGSISERICYLETQNEILLRRNDELSWKLDDVNRKLDMISENLFGFTRIQQAILMSLPMNGFKFGNEGGGDYEVIESGVEGLEKN